MSAKPISDNDLAVIRAQVAEWRESSNSVALGFRLADHVAPVLARLDNTTADRDRLAALVDKLRPYLDHDAPCPQDVVNWVMGQKSDPCNCGLAELLTEIGDQ